jgi:CheY-like chemotaxis protein
MRWVHQRTHPAVIFAGTWLKHDKRTETAQERLHLTTTPTILLIDDNANQAATRKTILKRVGYFVIAVLSPQRALEQMRAGEFAGDISLVITDHIMPGMNGAAFVRVLRETHPNLPVLVISGLMEAEAEYADLNIVFRLKPLLPDSLLATVHSMLHKPEEGDEQEPALG